MIPTLEVEPPEKKLAKRLKIELSRLTVPVGRSLGKLNTAVGSPLQAAKGKSLPHLESIDKMTVPVWRKRSTENSYLQPLTIVEPT